MTQTALRFLSEEEIESAKNEAGMIFWQDPEDVLVTVEQARPMEGRVSPACRGGRVSPTRQ